MSDSDSGSRKHTRRCQSIPNGNIPETVKIRLAWTHQEKRIRQRKVTPLVVPGKRRRGGLGGDGSTTPVDMWKI